MPWFRCLIEGENFPGSMIGKTAPVGFYTTRWVSASSPEEAEIVALEALRLEPNLQIDDAEKTTNAKIYFTEIDEVDGPDPDIGAGTGFAWFVLGS